MYFPTDTTRKVVQRIAHALRPDGYLFLGHAETLRGISNEFHLCHTHNTFYYQKRGPDAPMLPNPTSDSPPSNGRAHDQGNGHASARSEGHLGREYEVIPSAPNSGVEWVDAIARASDHIARLTGNATIHEAARRRPRGADPSADMSGDLTGDSSAAATTPLEPSVAGTHSRTWDTQPALHLLRQERFAEALELLRGLPAESHSDPDAQLLRAVLQTNTGDLTAAERTCAQLLAVDELNAGAHYLTALAREHVGDIDRAIEHHQMAAYLDPSFAMPRLHLGISYRRSSRPDLAKLELHRALGLLLREDAARILLFGGGFSREVLSHLCRTELQALERSS
jgi:chemotaxis protein methyltransferase CheR